MSVVSYSFFLFLFLAVIVYYVIPHRFQWFVLLVSSIIFYAFAGPQYLATVVITALLVYFFSLKFQKNLDIQNEKTQGVDRRTARSIRNEMKKERKPTLKIALFVVIGILVIFKGTGFLIENLNVAFGWVGLASIPDWKIIAPMGISFYTFMMISYLVDLYDGKIQAQKNFLKYLTYVLYFPHVTQGPIARYEYVSPQLYAEHKFDYDKVVQGIWLMLWGYFKKLAIADHLAPFTVAIFGKSTEYTGIVFLLAGILYSIQIYCDFSGCMDIVRGASECFGITLEENFERPYFSQTLPEFWRRWHITLGAFFREYIFYPVSTSKIFLKWNTICRKRFGNDFGKNVASCFPILCVWILTGVWHGANWNYIGWGLFHGILISLSTIFEQPLEKLTCKLNIKRNCFSWSFFRMVRTFTLCVIGRIIFMGNGIGESFRMLYSIVRYPTTFSLKVLKILNWKRWILVFGCIAILLAVSTAQEIRSQIGCKETLRECLAKQNLWLRWLILFVGILMILVLGKYGSGIGATFIYERF